MVVRNIGDSVWLTTDDGLTISVESDSLKTTRPAQVKRIQPGDSVIVQVGVENADGVAPCSKGPATAVAKHRDGGSASLNVTATYGIGGYEALASSINSHESPDWWRNAKYGIFIHWGIYSVPAWGNKGDLESYAEW
jgi:alpha-L-fucosidase